MTLDLVFGGIDRGTQRVFSCARLGVIIDRERKPSNFWKFKMSLVLHCLQVDVDLTFSSVFEHNA